MTASELEGWKRYALLEPFGPLREDERAGELAAVTANIWVDKKKRQKAFTWTDFFPPAEMMVPAEEKRAKTPGQMLQVVEALGIALKAQDNRRQRPRYAEAADG